MGIVGRVFGNVSTSPVGLKPEDNDRRAAKTILVPSTSAHVMPVPNPSLGLFNSYPNAQATIAELKKKLKEVDQKREEAPPPPHHHQSFNTIFPALGSLGPPTFRIRSTTLRMGLKWIVLA